MSKHIAWECLDMFKVYIVGRQTIEEDSTVFLTFANVWNLLNIFRAVAPDMRCNCMVTLHPRLRRQPSTNLASVSACSGATLHPSLTV